MRRAIVEKQRKVKELKEMLRGKRTVMIANIEGVPAHMFQRLRKQLRGRAVIKVFKNVIITRALEGEGDLEKLIPFVEGHPSAIIISDEDPIVLYREISAIYENVPLRPGKVSPVDVVLEPGPVPVPVTMMAEIKAAGIPVKSVKGSVQLDEEFVAVRKGDVVDERIARALELMGVKPVKVYLRVVAAFHDGLLFTEDVLSIRPEDVRVEVAEAAKHAFNLAYNVGYPTPQTVPFMLVEAHTRALNLAVNVGFITKETAALILSKAHAQAVALAARIGLVELPEQQEAAQEEKKEEEKKEEKKEEEATAGLASLFG